MTNPSGADYVRVVPAIVGVAVTFPATSQTTSASMVPPPSAPVGQRIGGGRRRRWAERGPLVPTGDLMMIGNSNSWRYVCPPCNHDRRAIDGSLMKYLDRLVLR